jgi:hypothetical protein
MAKLLAGSKSKRLEGWYDSPHYGRLRDYTRHELTIQLDILLQQRLLARPITAPFCCSTSIMR